MYALGDHKAGDTVTLQVKRGASTIEVQVTLEAGGAGGR
jgi:S1-C subfamily serine protease